MNDTETPSGPHRLDRNEQVMRFLVDASDGRVGRTRLVKLLYLVDHEAQRYLGRSITNFSWRVDNFGPFDPEFFDVKDSLEDKGLIEEEPWTTPFGNRGYRYRAAGGAAPHEFSHGERRILSHVLEAYSDLDRDQLVEDVVYQTEPFQAVEDDPKDTPIPMEMVQNEASEALGGVDVEEAEAGKMRLRAGEGIPLPRVLNELRS